MLTLSPSKYVIEEGDPFEALRAKRDMRDQLAKELEKIGLSENEAKVYLAGLELGPSTAQMIAAKATVSRPTTYIMIETLIKRGLMSSFQKGKKRFFSSSAPNQILYVITAQQRELEEKANKIKTIIDELNNISNSRDDETDVTLYEGVEGVRAFQGDILSSKVDTVYELTSIEKVRKYLPPKFSGDARESIGKKFTVKSLYAANGPIEGLSNDINSKILDPKKYDIGAELVIYGDKVAFISYGQKLINIVIKNGDIARTIRTLFSALWEKEK